MAAGGYHIRPHNRPAPRFRRLSILAIIRTHNVTLYGGNDVDIILKPLADAHLPLLYRWNADPEVLYWTEGGDHPKDARLSYDAATVNDIYGGVSQNALCFLVEANGEPIGEYWLQKMNLPDVRAMYPEGTDVRRIDMAIGEKAWWNRGVGTSMAGMLVNYAFAGEGVHVLHCFCEDYNARSKRVWEKNGFTRVRADAIAPGAKGKWQYHYRLTQAEYIERRRVKVPINKVFTLPLKDLQPSQLYISEGKLRLIRTWFNARDPFAIDPIPVKRFRGKWLMTDGHTRAALLDMSGVKEAPCYLDEDDLDMAAYATDIAWCERAGIFSAEALKARVVSPADYERLWRKPCMRIEDDPIYQMERARVAL